MARYHARFENAVASVGLARRALVQFAQCAGLEGAGLEDFECAIGEALANAVEHGERGFTVTAEIVRGTLGVEIGDGGHGFQGWNELGELRVRSQAPRGFGIFIMRSLMDRIEYSEGGSKIRLFKRLPARAGARLEA
ncbi:MAG TPA: ATP-binding protein [Polyangiaceae bacterium]|jgi:anti-sigma regulatory factor (Ser/Thr protein kinase)|nr:ATP-binding protein [Polyangiaceae bacterium]